MTAGDESLFGDLERQIAEAFVTLAPYVAALVNQACAVERKRIAADLLQRHPEDWKDNAGETGPRPWCWRCGTSWPCEIAAFAQRLQSEAVG